MTDVLEKHYGRVIAVARRTYGSILTAPASIAATVLPVATTDDFDEDGGQVVIAGALYDYVAIDETALTVTLDTGLLAAADLDDLVELYDPEVAGIVVEYVADVLLDDQDPSDEPIEVTVQHGLVSLLAESIRGHAAEAVVLIRDGEDDFIIWQIDGKLVVDVVLEEAVGEIDDVLAELNVDLAELNDVTLPALNADLADLNGLFPITATSISDGAISTPKLLANAITADKIVANAIGADKIAANSIGAGHIVANSIGTNHLAANAVTADKIATNSLTTDKIFSSSGVVDFTWAIIQAQRVFVDSYIDVVGSVLAGSTVHAGASFFDDSLVGGGGTGANINDNGKIIRTPSSERFKTDFEDLPMDLAALAALDSLTFAFRDPEEHGHGRFPGVTAEQAQALGFDPFVNTDSENRPNSFRYAEFATVAVIHLARENQALRSQVDGLTARVEALEDT